jgi:DNA replication protein DnaC
LRVLRQRKKICLIIQPSTTSTKWDCSGFANVHRERQALTPAKAFAEIVASGDAATLPLAEGLGLLLDRESSYRNDKRLASRLRYAKLRHQAAVEDVDYRVPRCLDKALFQKLIAGDWISAHDNLIFTGETDLGKSWLACALGHKACRDNRSVLYTHIPKLFDELALANLHGERSG